jgi:ribonuclease P protein component
MSQRLRSNRDFKRTYARGRSFVNPLLVLYVLPVRVEDRLIGFSISKKLGGSVVRNRIKRRLREVWRERANELKPGFHAILVGRSRLKEADFATMEAAVDALLRQAKLKREMQSERVIV